MWRMNGQSWPNLAKHGSLRVQEPRETSDRTPCTSHQIHVLDTWWSSYWKLHGRSLKSSHRMRSLSWVRGSDACRSLIRSDAAQRQRLSGRKVKGRPPQMKEIQRMCWWGACSERLAKGSFSDKKDTGYQRRTWKTRSKRNVRKANCVSNIMYDWSFWGFKMFMIKN